HRLPPLHSAQRSELARRKGTPLCVSDLDPVALEELQHGLIGLPLGSPHTGGSTIGKQQTSVWPVDEIDAAGQRIEYLLQEGQARYCFSMHDLLGFLQVTALCDIPVDFQDGDGLPLFITDQNRIVREINQFGLQANLLQLLEVFMLGDALCGHISNSPDNMERAIELQGVQADLHRKFRAILAPPDEFQPYSHRSSVWGG